MQMSLLNVEQTLRDALEVLDKYGYSMAGIHVANALHALEAAIAETEFDSGSHASEANGRRN